MKRTKVENPNKVTETAGDISKQMRFAESLQDNENNYRLLFENMLNGFASHKIITDPNGLPVDYVFLEVNKSFERMTGLARDAIIGKRVTEVLPEIEKEDFDWIGTYGNVALSGEPITFEQYFEPHDHWYYVSAYCPRPGYFAVTFEDITDRKRTERELSKKNILFDAFLEHSPVYTFFKDHEIRSLMLSKNYEQMLGMPLKDILGKTMDDIFPSELAKSMIEDDKRIIREGKTITVVEEFGGNFYETTKFPIHIEGEPDMIAGFTLDITERRQAEEALRKSETLLRTITTTAKDSIFCKNIERRYTFVNQAMTELFGCREEDLLGKTPDELFSPEDAKIINKIDDRTFKGEKISEIRKIDIGTKSHFFHTIQVPMQIEDGVVVAISGIVRDVTEMITAQQEKERLEIQLRQSHKMEAIGTMAGGIAHDFNNILASIIGYAELTQDDLTGHPNLQYNIKQILKAGFRAKDLVSHILSFCRQDTPDRKILDLRDILQETIRFLRATIPSTITIQENITPRYGYIMADATQMHQVIFNLCTNAVQAMEQKGNLLTISLSAQDDFDPDLSAASGRESGSWLHLSIHDNGPGIDPKIMDRIFDPYFTTKDIGQGSGMGLAVVHGIVKSHNGVIRVESKKGEWTHFHVYFPQVAKEVTDEAQLQRSLRKGSEHILLVDDEESVVKLTKRWLQRLGYQITAMTSSKKALEAFRAAPDDFALVITDQTMPEMTGELLARQLLDIRPDIPIILCTGFSTKIDAEKAKALGIREFVTKPVGNHELARIIGDILDGKD